MDLKIVLKSFPGRSFNNTWYSGDFRPSLLQTLCTALMTSETAKKVFGPEEHPKSAMARLVGKVVQ